MNKSSGSGASEGPHSRAAGREVRRTAHGATPHAPPHGRALANGGGDLRAQRIVSSWERLESRWEIHAKHRPDGYMREQGYGIRMGAEEGRVYNNQGLLGRRRGIHERRRETQSDGKGGEGP